MKLNFTFLYIFIVINFILSSLAVAKDTKVKEKLTLTKCLSIALANDSNYKSAYYNIKAKKSLTSIAALIIPDITFTTRYTYQQTTPIPIIPISPHTISNSININKVLYDFGKMQVQLSMAEDDYKIALLEAKKVRSDLIKNVRIAFFTVLLNKRNLNVIYEGHKILKENVEYQKRNFLKGIIPKFEYLRVQIQYENDRVQLQKTIKDFINSINNLYTLIGTKLISRLEEFSHNIVGTLPTILDNLNISSLDQAKGIALAKRVDIRKLHVQKRILESKKAITGAGWRPSISIFSNLSYDYIQGRSIGPGGISLGSYEGSFNWKVGAQIQFSLSDAIPGSIGSITRNSVGYDIKALKYNIQSLRDRVKKEVTQNYLTLKEAKSNIKKRRAIMELAKENFKIARKRFHSGGIDYLNYRDVELQARQAQIAYYRELYTYNVAYLNFADSIGNYRY